MFTNVPSPICWNLSEDTMSQVLRYAEPFLLDNPVALQKNYNSLKGDGAKKKVRELMRKAVLAGEERALEELVKLFDWLDSLRPQPTAEIVYLYRMPQDIEAMITGTFAEMGHVVTMKTEIDKLMVAVKNGSTVGSSACSYLELNLVLIGYRM